MHDPRTDGRVHVGDKVTIESSFFERGLLPDDLRHSSGTVRRKHRGGSVTVELQSGRKVRVPYVCLTLAVAGAEVTP